MGTVEYNNILPCLIITDNRKFYNNFTRILHNVNIFILKRFLKLSNHDKKSGREYQFVV